jgi:hypothetical protein
MDNVRGLLACLIEAGVDVTEREAAEALWLGVNMIGVPGPHPPDAAIVAQPEAPARMHRQAPPAAGPRSQPQRDHAPGVPLAHPAPATARRRRAHSDALPVRVPASREIRWPLDLQRALRPLKRMTRPGHVTVLDEEATATRSADARTMVPVVVPASERWLSLALVIDTSPSMVLWHDLAAELQALLGQLGAFRAIRTWYLRFGQGTTAISPANPAAAPRSPRELVDPTGRQAVLVLTDCVNDSWRTEAARQAIDAWARTGPAAILQPLSQRLWSRSALPCHHVQLRAPESGSPNHRLITVPAGRLAEERPGGVPVPILEIGPDWLASWARLVSGDSGQAHMIATWTADPSADSASAAAALDHDPPDASDPVLIVQRFMAGASAEAFRLAGLLSAAPVSLPVMRLIQQAMLPDPRPQHLAEVYLGGLLCHAGPHAPGRENPGYLDFLPGVRDVLLGSIRRSEAIRVDELVAAELSRRYGTAATGFTALVRTEPGTTGRPLTDTDQFYSEIQKQVLRRIGGRYAKAATDEPATPVPDLESRQPDVTTQATGDSPAGQAIGQPAALAQGPGPASAAQRDPAEVELSYRGITGALIRGRGTIVDAPAPAPAGLSARRLRLADGTQALQLHLNGADRRAGYERLDNEILAGLRLFRTSLHGHRGPAAYPPHVSQLLGYDGESAEPFALLAPYRGETVAVVGGRLLPTEQGRFMMSLFEGLRWLAAAGIAHRNINPSTVRWDAETGSVQITDFSAATIIGTPREVMNSAPWAAPEQRPGRADGLVSDRDDVWAAGRLVYFVLTGSIPTSREQLADPRIAGLLDGVFAPPEDRPDAAQLLARVGARNPLPSQWLVDPLESSRARFHTMRAARQPGPAATSPARGGGRPGPAPFRPEAGAGPDSTRVICPICLAELGWDDLSLWRWDNVTGSYAELSVPPGVNARQRARAVRQAMARCPDPFGTIGAHYLPAEYGHYGRPVVLGLVGNTNSGKSHLLSAMTAAIERGELAHYGIGSRPLDMALHHRFLEQTVRPLFIDGRVLDGTSEGIIDFADAWLITPEDGATRAVALYDVAGGELSRRDDSAAFLEIADGLIFVVDPDQLMSPSIGDEAFGAVLDLLGSTGRTPQVSAAVVVTKADLLRFEDPVALWLRSGLGGTDPDLTLRESADVFAYLSNRGAGAWTRPYTDCGKATLHVASATGGPAYGSVYPRPVTPCRVLAPLIALLAMTGVLPGEPFQRVGT